MVGLAEYFCTHPILKLLQRKIQTSFPKTLSRGPVLHQTLPVDRVIRRKFCMAQDSDDPLFVVNIIVWVLVVILAIVALHCPLPRIVVW